MGRVYKRGQKWYIDYTNMGKRIRKSVGNRRKIAERILIECEREKYYKNSGISIQSKINTKELFQQFRQHKQRQVSEPTMRNINFRLKFWEQQHNSDTFSLLQPQELNEIINNMEVCPAVINQYIATLNQLYRYAISLNIIKENPLKSISRFKEKRRKAPRFFTKEEVQTIMNLCSPFYKDLFTFMLYTGMSRDDIRNLKKNNIDFNNGIIKFQRRKTGALQSIPIHPEVRKFLPNRLYISEYIFCKKNGSQYSPNSWWDYFKRLLRKAGIHNASLHTFRHTFASWLVMEGVDLIVVSRLLGHKDIKTTQIYAHLAPDYVKKAINKLPEV